MRCKYILGPCVDGTQAGRRCSEQAVPGTEWCQRHTVVDTTAVTERLVAQ